MKASRESSCKLFDLLNPTLFAFNLILTQFFYLAEHISTIDISKAIYQNVINVAYKPEYPKRANKSRLEDDLWS